jgi:hypothetical protein
MSKKSIAASWGKTLGIASQDPSGEKVKKNTDKSLELQLWFSKPQDFVGFRCCEKPRDLRWLLGSMRTRSNTILDRNPIINVVGHHSRRYINSIVMG